MVLHSRGAPEWRHPKFSTWPHLCVSPRLFGMRHHAHLPLLPPTVFSRNVFAVISRGSGRMPSLTRPAAVVRLEEAMALWEGRVEMQRRGWGDLNMCRGRINLGGRVLNLFGCSLNPWSARV